mmetsp:Transcript_257/g.253  ORF Transcript_257/g.253 Transcript_257/m.253 type:complete len:101 (+) Transcript_257:169-471(+)
MRKRTQFNTNTGVRVNPFENEPFNMSFNDENIQLAVSWKGNGNTDILGEGYGSVKLNKLDSIFNPESGHYYYAKEKDYEAHICTEDEFPYSDTLLGEVLY